MTSTSTTLLALRLGIVAASLADLLWDPSAIIKDRYGFLL
jgi:hypothetical protein